MTSANAGARAHHKHKVGEFGPAAALSIELDELIAGRPQPDLLAEFELD